MAHQHRHDHDHDQAPTPAHSHSHNHDDIDFATMIPHLEGQAELFAPLYADALAWLAGQQPEPGLIVDAGSGPGIISGFFAKAFPEARIVAADSSVPLLERARENAERFGSADRFSTVLAELPGGLGELEYPADLVWSSRAVHHVGDQRAALTALAAVLAPGGTLAVMEGGLPERNLPRDLGFGRPGLETRLDMVEQYWFGEMRTSLPGHVRETEDWPALLTAAGLRPSGTRSFLLDLPAPLTDAARAYVIGVFDRRRTMFAEELDADDRATLDRLLDPDDKAGLHHRPDIFVLATHTVYTGSKPQT
ncbi:class I SAM-dependent methyltransferase [Streptomyces turgidiscabies]|uniref:Methyltransferase domain protein n=1 Tax=Streptomyces turgidiscabies (strain Car8) TaxID=698760 RepID=L7EX07_STRT8|nr:MULTISPECIES: class I SAM-dependent methyltransferase [Streptomyces]ELP62925.1 methyltransferase domain protein [Streptomyces turgidiscabies Car8]MDX3491250.1 class I SAM-dependent methyltransferase [Streptomyces turgidiscabies]GAQ73103.1 malonyl-[acyl-carrier protein] [Streptomyces turgidiscabies]